MARSRNIANYESIYWELLFGMQGGVREIKLTLPKKLAINTQQTFYAFIHALEHMGNVKKIAGEYKQAQDFTENANTMRGYIVTLRHEENISTLSFVNRDLNPNTQSIRDQIREQLKAQTPITQEDMDAITIKPKNIFDTPLKVSDNEQHD